MRKFPPIRWRDLFDWRRGLSYGGFPPAWPFNKAESIVYVAKNSRRGIVSSAENNMSTEATRGEFLISTDPAKLDLPLIHDFLTHSYWAEGINVQTVRRAIANSLCFGLFHGKRQIGFARTVTDRATFAYLADVFILEEWRGQGLSKWLMEVIQSDPELQGLRRWLLATRDAHELYRKYGYSALSSPGRFMERHDADVYRRRHLGGTI